jgi:hypothetical protein
MLPRGGRLLYHKTGCRDEQVKVNKNPCKNHNVRDIITIFQRSDLSQRQDHPIPSSKTEPFKRWLAKVGYQRVQEIENPELGTQRPRALYKAKNLFCRPDRIYGIYRIFVRAQE